MNDYSQPDFYRFNEDSLKLVGWLISRVQKAEHILDLGAGSGVLGIETANAFGPRKVTFVELQSDFKPHLEKNISHQLKHLCDCEIVISSIGEWHSNDKFDVAVINPPYFLPGHGQKNSDERREYARSFVVDGWDVLLNKLSEVEIGKIFIVIPNDLRITKIVEKYHQKFKIIKEYNGNIIFLELSRLHKN